MQQQQLSMKMADIAVVEDNSAQHLNDEIKDNSISECVLYKNEKSAWRNSIWTYINTTNY